MGNQLGKLTEQTQIQEVTDTLFVNNFFDILPSYRHISSYMYYFCNECYLSSILVLYLSGMKYQASGLTLLGGHQATGIAELKWDRLPIPASPAACNMAVCRKHNAVPTLW